MGPTGLVQRNLEQLVLLHLLFLLRPRTRTKKELRSYVRELLVNGGHTLQVHIDNNFTTDHNTYQEWHCENQAALTLLYSQFDRSESTRSTTDQCKAALDLLPEIEKWETNPAILGKCSVAVCVAKYGFNYRTKLSVAERVNLLKQPEWYPHAAFLRDFLFDTPNFLKNYKHMMKSQAVMSSIIETHCISSDHCQEFWEGVKTGAGLESGSSQLALKDFLVEQSGKKHGVNLWLIKARCHQAWNFWCAGKSVKNFRGKPPVGMPDLADPAGNCYFRSASYADENSQLIED